MAERAGRRRPGLLHVGLVERIDVQHGASYRRRDFPVPQIQRRCRSTVRHRASLYWCVCQLRHPGDRALLHFASPATREAHEHGRCRRQRRRRATPRQSARRRTPRLPVLGNQAVPPGKPNGSSTGGMTSVSLSRPESAPAPSRGQGQPDRDLPPRRQCRRATRSTSRPVHDGPDVLPLSAPTAPCRRTRAENPLPMSVG